MIFITAKFQVRPEDADRWMNVVADFTRGDPERAGLPVVRLVRSVDDPNEYVLIEAFRDNHAGTAHVRSDHFREAQKTLTPHLAETPRIINMTIPQDDWSRLGEMATD
jgi:quinol monooxygenase YgiN